MQYHKSVTVTPEPIWIHAYKSAAKGMAVVVKGIAEPVYKSQPLQQVPIVTKGEGGERGHLLLAYIRQRIMMQLLASTTHPTSDVARAFAK